MAEHPAPDLPEPRVETLSDTAAHAAATALVVAGRRCPDPVRSQSVRSLFAVITSAASGDGEPARRRAATIANLFEDTAAAQPEAAPLLLAAERWLLHPQQVDPAELLEAAALYARSAPPELIRAAWVAGAGLDAALAEVDAYGVDNVSAEALVVIGEATELIPLVHIAGRCGIVRDALRHRIRLEHPEPVAAWRC